MHDVASRFYTEHPEKRPNRAARLPYRESRAFGVFNRLLDNGVIEREWRLYDPTLDTEHPVQLLPHARPMQRYRLARYEETDEPFFNSKT